MADATVNFTVDAISVGSAVTNASGFASITTYNPSALLVGDHTVQASFAQQTISSTTYSASTSGNQTLTVTKANQAALTLNTTTPLTYNQSETLSVTGGTTGGTVTYNLLSGPCTILGNQLTANSGTGSCTLTATMAGDTNYNDVTSTPATTVNLQKANQAALTLTGVPASAAYNSMFTVIPGGGSSSNPLVVSTTGVCTAAGNDITMTSGTGTCTVKVNRAGDSNYNDATEVSASAAATKINQAALTLNTTSPLTYNQSESLSVTGGTTGGAVTYNLVSGPCTIFGNQLTAGSGTGSCSLTATMAGNSNYNEVTSAPANTVNLQKANQEISVTMAAPASAIINTSFTVAAVGGGSGNPVIFSSAGACTNVGSSFTMSSSVGICEIKYNQAGNANYNPALEVTQYTNVIFNFTGFFRPVDNLPVLNIVKAGSAVPVKFSLNGNQGLNIFATGYPVSVSMSCTTTDLYDYIEETVTAGGSSLSYDASANQYVYVWKTEKSWAGSCRQLVVKLSDGTYHRANFNFAK
ncbi:MAG TPA: PxKF domain-containing protein [Verrucomicrobiae bacterium]|nr:PxKF domain-containing protein [Verrucomicrobiae bacterium]